MNLKKWLRNRRRAAHLQRLGHNAEILTPERWVFIVGCYNSGTTLLHDVLANHPDVASLPREGQYCTDQLLIPSEVGLARAWALQPEKFSLDEHSPAPPDAQIVQRQWSNLMQPAGKKVYLEKSIPNAARIRWLNTHFDNACFIGFIRNGYAVAEGIHRKSGQALDLAAQQWRISNEIIQRDLSRVSRSFLLSYEDFTDNPEKITRQLCEFMGLDTTATELNNQQWQIHGVHSEITNMNQRSLDRLSDDDLELIDINAGRLLKAQGYRK